MKLSKKEVKELIESVAAGILIQMNTNGYSTIIGYSNDDNDPNDIFEELLVVNARTEYIPRHWKAGLYQSLSLFFGDDEDMTADLTRQDFANEEALRKVRDIFQDQTSFITWAWYN